MHTARESPEKGISHTKRMRKNAKGIYYGV